MIKLLIILAVLSTTALADELDIYWNSSESQGVEGTRLYQLDCENGAWANNDCSGSIAPTLVIDRNRPKGVNDCEPVGQPGIIECYHQVERVVAGEYCYSVTAYKGQDESHYGPIQCITIANIPEPIQPPKVIDIRLTCDTDCTVEIVK